VRLDKPVQADGEFAFRIRVGKSPALDVANPKSPRVRDPAFVEGHPVNGRTGAGYFIGEYPGLLSQGCLGGTRRQNNHTGE